MLPPSLVSYQVNSNVHQQEITKRIPSKGASGADGAQQADDEASNGFRDSGTPCRLAGLLNWGR